MTECIALNGTFSSNMGCFTVNCPVFNGTGACCNDGSCFDRITLPACTYSKGTFLYGTCNSVICPAPLSGACCLGNQCFGNYSYSTCTGFFYTNFKCAGIVCPTDSSSVPFSGSNPINSNNNNSNNNSNPQISSASLFTKWGIAIGAAALFLLVGTAFFVLRKRQIAKFNDEFYQPMLEIKDNDQDY